MRKHSGMKPQDIVILLKIIVLEKQPWRQLDIANSLFISTFEVSNSLHRCVFARLIDENLKKPFRKSLLEFLVHGLKYVYPVKPAGLIKGMLTAHSAPPLSHVINSLSESYVWPDVEGRVNGQGIEPLYANAPKAAKQDSKLYQLLTLIDALRIGRSREQNLAAIELKKRIEHSE